MVACAGVLATRGSPCDSAQILWGHAEHAEYSQRAQRKHKARHHRGQGAGRVLQTVALAEQRSREFGQVEEAADTLTSLCVAGEGWRQLAAFCRSTVEHRGAF